jgi:phosphoglucosamine mutase
MTPSLFGTDGIRGQANTYPMTAEIAMRVAMATAVHLNGGTHRHLVVIGKDTRLSGYMLEPALAAGFTAMGMDVVMTGPLPTPAIARLVRSMRADLGVMISASHNAFADNGIKLFNKDGFKLSDAEEHAIEQLITTDFSPHYATPKNLGKARRLDDGFGRYIETVKATFPRGLRLDGLKIVVDCAHGAAYKVAPIVLWELGAEVIPLGVNPNGMNINDGCGATAPEMMCMAVVEHGADIGIALDGDADRVIICDEKGQIVDGDQILGLIARYWQQQGNLRHDGIVSTVMSNLGLELYLKNLGITLHRTPVGDRHVVEKMRREGFNVGGEQSGHIVLGDHTTTGDGLTAALQVLAVLVSANKKASDVCQVFSAVPQKLKNIRGIDKIVLQTPAVKAAITDAEQRLNGIGRVLVRPSGTEPLIRIMVECIDNAVLEQVMGALEQAVRQEA